MAGAQVIDLAHLPSFEDKAVGLFGAQAGSVEIDR